MISLSLGVQNEAKTVHTSSFQSYLKSLSNLIVQSASAVCIGDGRVHPCTGQAPKL